MERYAGFDRSSMELVAQVESVVSAFMDLHESGEFSRVATAAIEGAALDQMKMHNLHLFGKLILQMGTQARHAALKRVLHHLKKAEFEEALFTLRLVSLGSGGAFSNMERKQLTELIESVMPPDVKARLTETADQMEGDGEGVGDDAESIDQRIGPMPGGDEEQPAEPGRF